MSEPTGPVAVLGSGLVSAAVAGAVLDDGRPVRVWGARSSWYLSAFTDMGAATAGTPQEAVDGAEVVVLAPVDAAERLAIGSALAGGLADSAVLTVRVPTDEAQWPVPESAERLDCVVFGRPTGIGTTSAVILVSGPAPVVARHRSLLDGLGVAIPVGGASECARRSEVALVGLWYDVNVAVLRALANIDSAARPIVDLALRAVLSQLPSVIHSVDTGAPVREDAGLALHARALETVIAARHRCGVTDGELDLAADQVASLLTREDPQSPLARITGRLRWPDGATVPDRRP